MLFRSWLAQDLPYSSETSHPTASTYTIDALQTQPIATLEDVLANHQNSNTVIWDARTAEEYLGLRVNAKQGGHIPNAVNYDWENAIDRNKDNLLRPLDDIRNELAALGITTDKEIITHCQTHHRSSFTWLLAKHLGFENVRGYAGSWYEWGNSEHTPIALPSAAELATYSEKTAEAAKELADDVVDMDWDLELELI